MLERGPRDAERVAIVGGGVSGLAAAYLLAPHRPVTLYEAAPRLGGHARTVMAGLHGDRAVDTGFIVFNYANYPHLTQMFRALDVPVAKSNMSFGATIDNGRIEYGLETLGALISQRRNLLRPGFLRMVRDILRFNAKAEAHAGEGSGTIGDLMEDLRMGDWFQRYYLTPLCGAIWSTPVSDIRDFPARSLIRFFRNHALLSANGQHQWWTVDGGSIEYVKRLEAHVTGLGGQFRCGAPVSAVDRDGEGVTIHAGGGSDRYDHVIFACHSDDALRLLSRPSIEEQQVLGAMRFQDNRALLHRDPSQMPKRRSVWSSWVYKAETTRQETTIGVTYWMNRLQNIPEDDPLFVTLNPSKEIREDMIYDEVMFRHPVFDTPALSAQQRLAGLQGRHKTWFAGAYTRHGFHEDGFASAVRVARAMERQPV